MNAYESRIESDYASDLRQVWLRRWQEREIRRRQFKYLGAMSLAFVAYVLAISIVVGVGVMIAAGL